MTRGSRKLGAGRRPAANVPPFAEDDIGPPISNVLWSPDVVAQHLEILAVAKTHGQLVWLKPVHAASLRVGLSRSARPSDVVVEVMGWYPLVPRVVHSTSWRYEEGLVVLTYVAVVDPPINLPPGSLVAIPIERAELARGQALGPPDSIGVAAVLEHALRHLSWLIRDDPVIATALMNWSAVLADYQPEPFRALA
ncbi:MAG TPA: hypothetical protein VKT80_19970 [Chloroflexota bacterium]|nr:hypothetical protein [Chloroflexota bacterium]